MQIGQQLGKRLSEALFRRILFNALMALGFYIIVRAAF
jgi:hypothetical protein